MELGTCPHCSKTVRSLNDDVFHCTGCYSEVQIACLNCKEDLQLMKGKLPKFCPECGWSVDLGSVIRTATELSCHACSEVIPRRKLQLPKFCPNCRDAIQSDQLRRVALQIVASGESPPAPIEDEMVIDDVRSSREMTGSSNSVRAQEIQASRVPLVSSDTALSQRGAGISSTASLLANEALPTPLELLEETSVSSNRPPVGNAVINSAEVTNRTAIGTESFETVRDKGARRHGEVEAMSKPLHSGHLESAAIVVASESQQMQSNPEQLLVNRVATSGAHVTLRDRNIDDRSALVNTTSTIDDHSAVIGRLAGTASQAGDLHSYVHALPDPSQHELQPVAIATQREPLPQALIVRGEFGGNAVLAGRAMVPQLLQQQQPPYGPGTDTTHRLHMDQTGLHSGLAINIIPGSQELPLPPHESLTINRHGTTYIKLETLPEQWGRSSQAHTEQAKNQDIENYNLQGGDGKSDNLVAATRLSDQPGNASYGDPRLMLEFRHVRDLNINPDMLMRPAPDETRDNLSDSGGSTDPDEYVDAKAELHNDDVGPKGANAVARVDNRRRRGLRRSDIIAAAGFPNQFYKMQEPFFRHMDVQDELYFPRHHMDELLGNLENPAKMVARDFIDVTFYVTVSQSFTFDEKADWPMIEFYGFGPEDRPYQRPLTNQCLPSGRFGWMVAVRLPSYLLNREQPLRYKYLVQHSSTSGLSDTYEWIHKNTEGEDCVSRELRLPRDTVYKEQWAQYDLIMLPQKYRESETPPSTKNLLNLFTRDSGKKGSRRGEFPVRRMLQGAVDRDLPIDANQRRLYESIIFDTQAGLESMLPDFMFCIANGNMKATEVIECFVEVVSCIRNGKIFFLDESLHSIDEDILQKAVASHLVERAKQQEQLMQRANDQPVAGDQLSQLMRIVAGLVLVILASHWRSGEVYDRAAAILASFNTTGLSRSTIEEFLQSHFTNFSVVAFALRSFMVEAACSGDAEWLWAVPLYHILRGSTTYDRRSCKHHTPLWWGLDGELERCMQAFKAQARKFKVRDWFSNISSMADQSWISARTFIAALNTEQLRSALDQQLLLPVDGYVAALLRYCLHAQHRLTNQESATAFDDLLKLLQKARRPNAAEAQRSHPEPIMNSLEILNEAMFDVGRSVAFKSWELILWISRLVAELYSTPGLLPEEGPLVQQLGDLITNFHDKVGEWLSHALSFAMADPNGTTFKERTELEMWESLFGVTWHVDKAQAEWVAKLESTLQNRLDKVDGYAKVALYCMIDFSSPHVENILGAAAVQAADGVMQSSSQDIDYNRSARTLEKYGKIFSSAFNRAWEQQSGNDSKKREFMLTWPRFSTYISLTCGEHSMVLEETCVGRISECVDLLTKCCTSLRSGNIMYMDLDFLVKHTRSFVHICQQLCERQSIDECARDISQCLAVRQQEKTDFDELHSDLRIFVALCERLGKVQLMELPRKLDEDLSKKPLHQLWVPAQKLGHPGAMECRQFPYTKTICTPDLLHPMRKVSVSSLFVSYWVAAGNVYQKQRESANPSDGSLMIELKDVVGLIWKHAYTQYNDFVNRLLQGVATFSDAGYLLKVCDSHEKQVAKEVEHLMQGSAHWKEVNKRIKQYSTLCLYGKGAKVMRTLKDRFLLTGDFSDLEVLINWDQDQNRKLRDITDKLIDAGKKLKAMDDPKKVDCLEAFVDCKSLIDWVKENVSESKELKVFVDLASIVAGEGDHEVEKVSCLHAAVTGYAPLIYDLPQYADLSMFLNKCEAVWKSLDTNGNLTKQLKDTANIIDWVKSVKDAYGAVEFTSLAQATELNEKGTFKVGRLPRDDLKLGYQNNALDYVVCAKVPGKAKQPSNKETSNVKVEDKKYNYSELSELQSKLMLVAGKAEQDNPEVEKFVNMFRNITRLANAYVKASEVGTVLFESWRTEFFCDKDKGGANVRVVFNSSSAYDGSNDAGCESHASNLADFLEKCVEDWKSYMQCQRQKHVELNYFTTQQIVFLRKELGRCVQANVVTKNCSEKIYPLLAMLVPCNWLDVEKALSRAVCMPRDVSNPSTSGSVCELPQRPRDTGVKVRWHSLHLDPRSGEHGWRSSSSDTLVRSLEEKWHEFLESASTDTVDSVSVEHLGYVLQYMTEKRATRSGRCTPPGLARGQPHLIVCPHDHVLYATLSLYMADPDYPMPTRNEVLVCTEQTSLEEVELLLQRAVSDEQSLYCLAHAQRLNYDLCGHVEKRIEDFQNGKRQYFIAVICAEENEDRSRMVTALERFRVRSFHVQPIQSLCDYVQKHLEAPETTECAAAGCSDRSSARLVRSRRAGVGKTLHIRRLMEKLKSVVPKSVPAISIQLVQQDVDLNALLHKLLTNCCEPINHECRIIHVNIAQEVLHGVDELLFNLLILGSICQQEGFVWQRSKMDYYAIETVPLKKRLKINDADVWQTVHSVLEILPARECISPNECLQYYQKKPNMIRGLSPILMDDEESRSESWQRTYQYLKKLKEKKHLSGVDPSKAEDSPEMILPILLEYCNLSDPSWAELRHFIHFLNVQLRDCELSAFCSAAAKEDLPGFLEFVVKFMLQMSKDFATRSLLISEESPEAQLAELQQHSGDSLLHAMEIKHRWENSPHPYIFFNPDHNSLTFLGFCVERRNGNILVPRTARILDVNAVSKDLFDGLERNNVDLSEDFESKSRIEKIEKICSVMGNNSPCDPDPTYELTLDNVKKILAIQMRFRCGIPVIIMGETGCGKTRLVKFMCDLQVPAGQQINNLVLMKIHGGITAEHVKKKVREALELAKENKGKLSHVDTVLFLDEANTTDAIGLIKEVMCDGSLDGTRLNDIYGYDVGLRIVAAVNPYRKHSQKMIEQLERAGLGYNVKADETSDRLGSIPMRHLVYRVRALPQSMLPLVWDFGRLSSDVEEKYISQMISKHDLPGESGTREAIAKVLVKCQDFMRSQKDECSFVSLRDIDRVLKVMSWFLKKERLLRKPLQPAQEAISDDSSTAIEEAVTAAPSILTSASMGHAGLSPVTWSLVLALGVCYHACLQPRKRSDFRRVISSHFRHPLALPNGDRQMLDEIEQCQQLIIHSLSEQIADNSQNIAHNHALKENIFMMVVCMELRIPLFLVGKPGSSKSLAKFIIADAMQGEAAKSELFKNLKQVHLVSFQCSPLATPEGIIATFKQCARFQRARNLDKFVSVVVLDEVGLAEDSKLMPLKTLHPLLEEGCDGDEKPEPYMKCAFIGISNWALDPAKMNRGILVQRGVPDKKELEDTAKGICQFDARSYQAMAPCIGLLATAYLRIFDEAGKHREFFGLRDFYSLMKMVAHFARERGSLPTPRQFRHAILRNFGGLENIDVITIYENHLGKHVSILEKTDPEPGDPPCDAIGLIDASLTGQYTRDGGESRYLLILTENDTALSLIQSKLQVSKPEIIFGSNFPKDLEYTQVCRNINRIKVCMETGTTVMLLNLENLYESLYDALNQYYVEMGRKRFVDLGLGTHRVKCRVHDDFRLIVIADKEVVHNKFPIPLINRLEKHYVSMTSILTSSQQDIVKKLCLWARDFVRIIQPVSGLPQKMQPNVPGVSPEDAFVGYSDDTVAALVLQVVECQFKPHERIPDTKILERAKLALLSSATPDAVLRAKQSTLASQYDKIFSDYYQRQQHDSLGALLHAQIVNRPVDDLFLQVTTHYKLLSREDVNLITKQLSPSISGDNIRVIYALQALNTEQQFSREIRDFYTNSKESDLDWLLIVQCEAGHENVKLISCARYIIWREYNSITSSSDGRRGRHHVVLVVQLPQRAQFRGFHGGRWTCIHVDDLRPQKRSLPTIDQVYGKAISEVLAAGLSSVHSEIHDSGIVAAISKGGTTNVVNLDEEATESAGTRSTMRGDIGEQSFDTYELLRNCLLEAASRLRDSSGMPDRSLERLKKLISLFSEEGHKRFQELFCACLIRLMRQNEVERMSPEMCHRWLNADAASMQNVVKFGTFRKGLENCLERRIAPLFAVIVAFMDTNCNLDLLTSVKSSNDEWLGRLWLDIFSGIDYVSSDMSLTFGNIVNLQQRYEVPIICKSASGTTFTPQFPFSWLLKEQLDAMMVPARSRRDISPLLNSMLAKDKAFGCIMNTLVAKQQEDATNRYLHDFVYLACRCKKDNPGLHQILMTSIKCVMQTKKSTTIPDVHLCFAEIEPRLQRLLRIVELEPSLVDKVLHELQANELSLEGDPEMLSDIIALRFLLLTLEPKNICGEPLTWSAKVRKCHVLVEETLRIGDVVSGEESKCASLLRDCRQIWGNLLVSLIFMDHMISFSNLRPTQPNIFGMCDVEVIFGFLASDSDFKKKAALDDLEKFLEYCNNKVITSIYGASVLKRLCAAGGHDLTNPVLLPCRHVMCSSCLQNLFGTRNQGIECSECGKVVPYGYTYSPDDPRERECIEQHREFKQLFNLFFNRILLELVFAGKEPPEEAAMKHVLTYVEIEEGRSNDGVVSLHTKPLSPLIDVSLIDPTPVIRSFLLQLLLRASEGFVNKHVSEYFQKTINITENAGGPAVTEFCVLFITCLEDYNIEKLNKGASPATLPFTIEKYEFVKNALRPQGPAWRLFVVPTQLDANTHHAIAALRLSLVIGADVICNYMITTPEHATAREASTISRAVSEMCDHAEEQGNCYWPRRFLAKQIIRKFGATTFHSALSIPYLRYILPKDFDNIEDAAPLSDLFVVASDVKIYTALRAAVSNSIVDGKMDAFQSFISKCTESKPVKDMYSIMAICAVFIRNYRGADSGIYIRNEAKSMIEQFATRQWPTAKGLLAGVVKNSFPDKLNITPRSLVSDIMVAMLIYRIAIGLLTEEQGATTFVSPLSAIVIDPSSMQKAYFPSMPHDQFMEVKDVIKKMSTDVENLLPYACPNGHIYYIGNCGRAYVLSKCPECGTVIGGQGHIAAEGNREVKLNEDHTKSGHVLGSITSGTSKKQTQGERDLSPLSCIILRAVLHMTLYASAAINGKDKVAELVNPKPENLAEFLWVHVVHDIECLQAALNKSFDDCLIFLHAVTARLVGSNEQVDFNWSTQDGRRKWETTVQATILIPAIQNFEDIIAEGAVALKSDSGNSSTALALARLLEEIESTATSGAESLPLLSSAALWRYRESPSVEHFMMQFENHCSTQTITSGDSASSGHHGYTALQKFLRCRAQLAAIRFLPDALALITALPREYGRKIDIAKADSLTIRQFLEPPGHNRPSQEYSQLLNSFIEAWNTVRAHLPGHTFWCQGQRLQAPVDLCANAMSSASPLRMLLVGTRGPGLCSLALVTYLAKLQNEFLDLYTQTYREGLEQDVPLLSISQVHLIAFDADTDLLPIILGNCEYSLKAGEGSLVRYDFDNIQRQIMNLFVRHKPPIMLACDSDGVDAIPRFLYREDLANGNQFDKLTGVLPQEALTLELKDAVRRDYHGSISELSDALVVIDQAVGFLVTTRTLDESQQLLSTYLQTVLQMPDSSMSPTMHESCYLRHVRAIWLLLSLERAKALAKNQHECFEGVDAIYCQPIGEQEAAVAAKQLATALRKRLEVAEKVSEILYELIVLKLANKRQEPAPDADAEEDFAYQPTYPLFYSLSMYAKQTYENGGISMSDAAVGSLVTCLDELSEEYGVLQLQHSTTVWRLVNAF